MKVELAYGETGPTIDVAADRTTVVTPHQLTPAPDERGAVLAALRHPTTAAPPRRDELARFGPDATLCVLPEGPQTIAYVEAP